MKAKSRQIIEYFYQTGGEMNIVILDIVEQLLELHIFKQGTLSEIKIFRPGDFATTEYTLSGYHIRRMINKFSPRTGNVILSRELPGVSHPSRTPGGKQRRTIISLRSFVAFNRKSNADIERDNYVAMMNT